MTAYVIARYPHATMLVGRRISFIEVPTWTFTTVVTCMAAYFGLDRWYRIGEETNAEPEADTARTPR